MTTVSTTDAIRAISLEQIKVSNTGSQEERRRHFDKTAINELAISIRQVGLLSPIIARPVNGHFEVVAGERRYLAAQVAGLSAINVSVRDLTDEQVLEIQLIENLQREGLHELAEAEGYEGLQRLGHSANEIAVKVGKSKAYVYARMKLLALTKEARKAFYEEKITASVALLLARIPDEDLQRQALKEVLEESDYGPFGEGMSYREAAEHIQHNYMLRLKDAPFPTGDETLSKAAGPCTTCPKNTAQQRELFKDVEHASAGVCTDPTCFKSKREAWGKTQIAAAAETHQQVISGGEAKKIAKYGTHSLQGGYVKLDEKCFEDSKHRTYRQILGKDAAPALLVVPDTGDVLEVVTKQAVAAKLPKVRTSSSHEDWKERQKAEEKKRKRELAFRMRLFTDVRLKAPSRLGRPELEAIAEVCFNGIGYEAQKQLLKAWGWTDNGDKPMDPYAVRGKRIREEIAAHSDDELVVFLLDCTFADELTGDGSKPDRLLAAAKRLRIDPEKIRKDLAAEAKPAPKKVAKAKVARKPK